MEERTRRIIDTIRPRRVARVHHLMVQAVVEIEEAGFPVEERPQSVVKLFHPFDVRVSQLILDAERACQQQLDAEGEAENPL